MIADDGTGVRASPAEQLPEWARWIAVDDDGCVWGFSHLPQYFEGEWYVDAAGLPKMTCLGPILPKEIAYSTRFPDEGNGQLWRIDDPEAADDPAMAAWICLGWLIVVVVVIAVTGSVPSIRAWVQGLFG